MKLDQKSRGLTTSLIDEHGKTVAVVDSDRAAEIARAVNSHEAAQRLAEAAKLGLKEHECIGAHSWSTSKKKGLDYENATCDVCDGFRAALAEWEAVK